MINTMNNCIVKNKSNPYVMLFMYIILPYITTNLHCQSHMAAML